MKEFIVTEISKRDITKINKRGYYMDNIHPGLLFQDCAFHKLPRKFTDSIISTIKWMFSNKIVQYQLDLRSVFRLINKNQIHNFDQFYNFTQLLSNSTNKKILTLRISNINSYVEPQELYEFSDKQYDLVFNSKPYEENLRKEIKDNISKAFQLMKQNVNQIQNLGILTINIKDLQENYVYDNDDTIIGHQIRHFIIFLQRWSKCNNSICRYYSNQNIKSYCDINGRVIFNKYVLDENEFIPLASTYIERMINLFLKNRRSLQLKEVELLIKSVLVKTNLYKVKILNNDLYWYDKLDENEPKIKSIITFFKEILTDSKYGLNKRKDKFKTLLKWTYKSFLQKIEEMVRKK